MLNINFGFNRPHLITLKTFLFIQNNLLVFLVSFFV
jgi:hypothetical protein